MKADAKEVENERDESWNKDEQGNGRGEPVVGGGKEPEIEGGKEECLMLRREEERGR